MASVWDSFVLERVLNSDPVMRTITLLGRATLPSDAAAQMVMTIIRMEKVPWDPAQPDVFKQIGDINQHLCTDIYRVLFGTLKDRIKMDVICPATETHIRKYSQQQVRMVSETPDVYRDIVHKYIDAFPPQRTQWVKDILSGHSEVERILYSDPDFLILPDMKWDGQTISSLYLVALSHSTRLRSLRDLRGGDVDVLKRIKREAERVVWEKWGVERGGVRCYVHYQPSYYHFHVHIVNANTVGFMGATVGQAHLLDDIISLLEVDGEIMIKLTFTYGLGEQHGLYQAMLEHSGSRSD